MADDVSEPLNFLIRLAQPLIDHLFFDFNQLARGIVGADQQIADDASLRVAQCGDRDHRREAAAVLAEIGQFVDVLDPARRLEDQRLEARRDRGCRARRSAPWRARSLPADRKYRPA